MSMNVSINPSYFCNFNCSFCYLTKEQLADTKKIPLAKLDKLLGQIPDISYVDLYGGEIGALKKDYFYGLKDVIRNHYKGEINIITNYSMLHEGFFADDVYLSVSYDFSAREKQQLVFQNMLMSPVPIAVLILASEEVLNMSIDSMISELNMCSSIQSVEIKPYSINQSNAHSVTHRQFEDFVIKWLESPVKNNFEFINEIKIKESLAKKYNAFSDNHVYITPNGKFGVLEFDKNDREYFLEMENYSNYEQWAFQEKITLSDICNRCEFLGSCLTEHYRYVKDLDNSCNGYYGLLKYYENATE